MKKTKIGRNMVLLFIILGVIETWYFGWNEKPINETEALLDKICSFGISIGLGIYLIPFFQFLEDKIKDFD